MAEIGEVREMLICVKYSKWKRRTDHGETIISEESYLWYGDRGIRVFDKEDLQAYKSYYRNCGREAW